MPIVEIALLRHDPLFAPLGAPALEALARAMAPLRLRAGECVIREGQTGEHYYVVADGRLEVVRGDVVIDHVGRGEGVGEISLLERVPCVATVRAGTESRLYAIEPLAFVGVVGGHPTSAAVGRRLVAERLGPQSPAST